MDLAMSETPRPIPPSIGGIFAFSGDEAAAKGLVQLEPVQVNAIDN